MIEWLVQEREVEGIVNFVFAIVVPSALHTTHDYTTSLLLKPLHGLQLRQPYGEARAGVGFKTVDTFISYLVHKNCLFEVVSELE